MNLLALLLGLFLEHRLTRLFSLREPRWFDAWFDASLRLMSERYAWLTTALAVPVVVLPVLPVLVVSLAFGDRLFGLPYVGFAVLMLLLSLGPRNLQEDAEDFVDAEREGRSDEVERLAKALCEHDPPPPDALGRADALAQAVFVQANNRLFGVIFWFVVLGPVGLGPVGAWLFRVSDLLRRRATFEAERRSPGAGEHSVMLRSINRLHGLLAWLPARLLALGYALAGSFDQAMADWKAYLDGCSDKYFDATERVLACVGLGAIGSVPAPSGDAAAGDAERVPEKAACVRVEQAMALVNRALWIWLTGIALMTLAGSVR
jgi:AmpE protein